MTNFQPSNTIVNGYFYSFIYDTPSLKMGYDKTPFVFVIGPSLKSLNNFVGINLHHLPIKQREYFIKAFQRDYKFMNNTRTVLDEKQCEGLLNGISLAFREYNKKFIKNCISINSKSVPLYIYGDGFVSQETPNNTTLKWMEERGMYVSKESNK